MREATLTATSISTTSLTTSMKRTRKCSGPPKCSHTCSQQKKRKQSSCRLHYGKRKSTKFNEWKTELLRRKSSSSLSLTWFTKSSASSRSSGSGPRENQSRRRKTRCAWKSSVWRQTPTSIWWPSSRSSINWIKFWNKRPKMRKLFRKRGKIGRPSRRRSRLLGWWAIWAAPKYSRWRRGPKRKNRSLWTTNLHGPRSWLFHPTTSGICSGTTSSRLSSFSTFS